jgi:hypothetical protein
MKMADLLNLTDIDQAVALDWLHYSLGQGEIISPAALRLIEGREGHAYALAPEGVKPTRLAKPSEGGVIIPGTGWARQALTGVLEMLAGQGAMCVVVEDELRLKRDPKPSLDGLLLTGFVGEKVVHWANLAGGVADALVTVDRGSGDYPTNAFVVSVSAEMLRLVDGADLAPDVAGRVVPSLVAVVVAAYDAETYIIWKPD